MSTERKFTQMVEAEKEEWKLLEGTNMMFSNLGNAKSVGRSNVNSLGHVRYIKQKPYKMTSDKDGYLRITVHLNGKQKLQSVHRIIAYLFLHNTEAKQQVNHKNGLKNDNRVENLEWCTPKENITHSYDNGLVKNFSDGHYRAKINSSIVVYIRMVSSAKILTSRDLSDKFNISRSSINNIISGKSWKRI